MAKKTKSKKVKYIYDFGKKTDGKATQKELLGGKGANLAEMARIGLPVPPGFTFSTEVCTYFYDNGRKYPKTIEAEMKAAVVAIEKQEGKKFGSNTNPLLFSVRSGARESMPGMMDTILNLGLNDTTVKGLAKKTGNARFAYDCYRRFIQMYGDVVMDVKAVHENDHCPFEVALDDIKKKKKVKIDSDLTAEHLMELIENFKKIIKKQAGTSFPQEVYKQLWGAVGAVFNSWQNERATLYRQKYGIPAEWGTAVNVQTMVFGNMGETSGTGVAFTRDPANGENVFYGEYLINAQGEDVVAGIRTPKPIAELRKEMPKSHKELEVIRKKLEKHFGDMQDLEFTVEDTKLYILQTRNGKRTGLAAVRIAVEMVKQRLMNVKTAVSKIPAESISSLLVPVFEAGKNKAKAIAVGLPAGPGAASGKMVFTSSEAEKETAKGNKVVLCRVETSPEDLRGMIASEGILTSRGGVSSHAALVARQMGKVCVCGAQDVVINYKKGTLKAGKTIIKLGADISIDGTSGEIFPGKVNTMDSEVLQVLAGKLKPAKSYTYQLFDQVMKWSDKFRTMEIRTNADTPTQSKQAIQFGAKGIGLCRTEHMFFEGDRIAYMRSMILADNEKDRRIALKKLLPYQRKDFAGIFKAMKGYPVTIRLLDPPLHEFLPHDDATSRKLAKSLKIKPDYVIRRIQELHEENPMLGHRGCRLGISYPEITEMQATAIFEAAAQVKGSNVEVMVPLTSFKAELDNQVAIINQAAKDVMKKKKCKIKYMVGTMIEIPRAAICAGEIAETAEFFSFGTNDLTQTGLGMSRDDSASFLGKYKDLDIMPQNPFATIDKNGVGGLVEIAAERGRKARKGIKLGVCGEHGGDPDSINFFHNVGLNYVSCSPPRVPVARLAAAQAAIG